jgi:hypothetical protein
MSPRNSRDPQKSSNRDDVSSIGRTVVYPAPWSHSSPVLPPIRKCTSLHSPRGARDSQFFRTLPPPNLNAERQCNKSALHRTGRSPSPLAWLTVDPEQPLSRAAERSVTVRKEGGCMSAENRAGALSVSDALRSYFVAKNVVASISSGRSESRSADNACSLE